VRSDNEAAASRCGFTAQGQVTEVVVASRPVPGTVHRGEARVRSGRYEAWVFHRTEASVLRRRPDTWLVSGEQRRHAGSAQLRRAVGRSAHTSPSPHLARRMRSGVCHL